MHQAGSSKEMRYVEKRRRLEWLLVQGCKGTTTEVAIFIVGTFWRTMTKRKGKYENTVGEF